MLGKFLEHIYECGPASGMLHEADLTFSHRPAFLEPTKKLGICMCPLKVDGKNGWMVCVGQESVLVESWEILIEGWPQKALGSFQEVPKKFCCFDKNFKVLML